MKKTKIITIAALLIWFALYYVYKTTPGIVRPDILFKLGIVGIVAILITAGTELVKKEVDAKNAHNPK